jgi:Holliday junction resolvasome RuvABC ATP-dependent DNA helicase subunit
LKKAFLEEESKKTPGERELVRQSHGLACVIGQGGAIQRLKEFAALYSHSGRVPAHVLFTGIEGIGKRTLARAFASEYCAKLVEADARGLARTGDLMGILTNLGEGDALLIGDVQRTSKTLVGFLHPALSGFSVDLVVDKGMFARTIKVPLKRFTCLATAPCKAKCPAELADAFPLVVPLQSYSQRELVRICEHLAQRKGIGVTPAGAALIAGVCGGTPHHIEALVERLLELGKTTISGEDVAQVSSILGLGTGPVGSTSAAEIDSLSGGDFERVIAALLRAMGFRTELTEASGDGGIDIVAILDRPLIGGRYLIQCKRFAPDNVVGAATVRDFYGAVTADRRAVKGILITTSGFSPQALTFAQQLPIELIDGHHLRALLAQYGISAETQRAPGTLFE